MRSMARGGACGRVLLFVGILTAAVASAETGGGASQPLRRQPPSGELVERTLAIVAGTAITLSDVRAAMALGLVEATRDVDGATGELVERALKLREVERYAPPAPDAARIDAQLSGIRERLGAPQLQVVLAANGLTEARLRAWIRDDLRIATYLEQRFAADGPERRASLIADWVADLRRRTPIVELWRQ
jgi:hypothetical protein